MLPIILFSFPKQIKINNVYISISIVEPLSTRKLPRPRPLTVHYTLYTPTNNEYSNNSLYSYDIENSWQKLEVKSEKCEVWTLDFLFFLFCGTTNSKLEWCCGWNPIHVLFCESRKKRGTTYSLFGFVAKYSFDV